MVNAGKCGTGRGRGGKGDSEAACGARSSKHGAPSKVTLTMDDLRPRGLLRGASVTLFMENADDAGATSRVWKVEICAVDGSADMLLRKLDFKNLSKINKLGDFTVVLWMTTIDPTAMRPYPYLFLEKDGRPCPSTFGDMRNMKRYPWDTFNVSHEVHDGSW